MIKVRKKDGTYENFNPEKIVNAVSKSAYRALSPFKEEELKYICDRATEMVNNLESEGATEVNVPTMHNIVETILEEVNPVVAKSYRDYRNYKQDFVKIIDEVYKKAQSIMYIGDRSNANTDSTLVSTKRSLIYSELNKELYQKFFMTVKELQACRDGYIYAHDMVARRDSINCFRRDTRFITKDGIKSFYDFSEGDQTMVLSHRGIWRKATVHKYGWQKIQKVTISKGTPTSKPVEIYCTPDHRWILKDGSETTSLKVGDILYQVPDITKFNWDELSLENKKLWCRGFALGDGCLNGSATQNRPTHITIRLCGYKTKYADRFADCGYAVTERKNTTDLSVTMLDTNTKNLPYLTLNYTNILYYINGFMCADGNRRLSKGATSDFRSVQVTGRLNEVMYDLLNISGYFVTCTRDLTNETTNYGSRTDITIHYNISSTQNRTASWRVKDISPATLNPKAEVWCLEVEEDHSFLLEGGIPTGNCCLFDMGSVLKDGFNMGNIFYTEPNTLDVAFDVISDVTLSAASQQYGGFTIPEVDKILEPYAQKSYKLYYDRAYNRIIDTLDDLVDLDPLYELDETAAKNKAMDEALELLWRDFEQGFQGWEMKFNTVASSRGDYPFTTITFGLGTSKFAQMASLACLKVRADGQGRPGFKRPVLFPKLVFLYDENLHGEGKVNEKIFEEGVRTSTKCMYPDWLSLSGDGYLPDMYKKYGEVVSPMGKLEAAHVKHLELFA